VAAQADYAQEEVEDVIEELGVGEDVAEGVGEGALAAHVGHEEDSLVDDVDGADEPEGGHEAEGVDEAEDGRGDEGMDAGRVRVRDDE